MTALTAGYDPAYIPGPRSSHRYQALVKSGEKIFRSALTAKDPSTGKWVEAISTDTGQIVHGFADLGEVDNADNSADLYTAEMLVVSATRLLAFGSITQADEGKTAYVADDQTLTLVPGGPVAGVVQLFSDSTHAYVLVDPIVNKALALAAQLGGGPAFTCRGVITSLAANTVTTGVMTMDATGALASQDGLTPAVNDVFFVQEGTTNLDNAQEAGPWQITTLGATGVANVFTRPSWWAHGAPIVPGAIIEIGGEGTGTTPRYAGSTWKSFVAKGKLIGTDAPVFWPRELSTTPAAFSSGVSPTIAGIPIRAATGVGHFIANTGTAAHASTRVWRPTTITPGVLGTASLVWTAESAPATANASDVGVYTITVVNW